MSNSVTWPFCTKACSPCYPGKKTRRMVPQPYVAREEFVSSVAPVGVTENLLDQQRLCFDWAQCVGTLAGCRQRNRMPRLG